MAISLKRRLRRAALGITRLYHNVQCVQPFGQGRQGYRLSFDGMGFIKVPGAQVSVKEKFFPRVKAFCRVKSSD
jgi:hypothetical protein